MNRDIRDGDILTSVLIPVLCMCLLATSDTLIRGGGNSRGGGEKGRESGMTRNNEMYSRAMGRDECWLAGIELPKSWLAYLEDKLSLLEERLFPNTVSLTLAQRSLKTNPLPSSHQQ
jgi:hypothetical protein